MKTLSLLLGLATLISRGYAGVIDFEDLGVAAGTQLNPPINATTSSGGFDFSSLGADLHFHNQNGFGDDGSTHLGAHGFVDFAPTLGGVFTLNSFSFDYFVTDLGSISVIGTLFGGGTTTQVFTTDGIVGAYETLTLDNTFTDLTSARIDSGLANSIELTGFFVDDIITDTPEPSAQFLLGAGLALFGLARWRRSVA